MVNSSAPLFLGAWLTGIQYAVTGSMLALKERLPALLDESRPKQAHDRVHAASAKRSAFAPRAVAGFVFSAGLASGLKPITITARSIFPLKL